MLIRDLFTSKYNHIYTDDYGDYIFCINSKTNIFNVYYIENNDTITCVFTVKLDSEGMFFHPMQNGRYIFFGKNDIMIFFDKYTGMCHTSIAKEVYLETINQNDVLMKKIHDRTSIIKKGSNANDELLVIDEKINLRNLVDDFSCKIDVNCVVVRSIKYFDNGVYLLNNFVTFSKDKHEELEERKLGDMIC